MQNGNNGNGHRHDSDQNLKLEYRDTDPVVYENDEPTKPEVVIDNDPLSLMLKSIVNSIKNMELALVELSETVASHHASVIQHYEFFGAKLAELERRQNGQREEIKVLKQTKRNIGE